VQRIPSGHPEYGGAAMIATAAFSVKDRAGRIENIIGIFQMGSQSFQAGAFAGPRSPDGWKWRALPVMAETTYGCISVLETYMTEHCPEYHLVERDTPSWKPDECGVAA
jgi:hypothetical protein